ncbi:MAG: GNAT family N-acetyltransferase [Deltaproteobacteria bacterium]|nr:GNAT family N-acetyltransferase [Deltaproteobacteria bacterium]
MIIEPFCSGDITAFLELAAVEGWVAETWECEFLLAEFPQGCFAARGDNREIVGFVTSLRHLQSGWIGNLIVAPKFRGSGIGAALFRKALGALFDSGVETVWLTASKVGMPLYQKYGFIRIDTIIRWNGEGQQRRHDQDAEAAYVNCGSLLSEIDGLVWGDRRAALVAVTAGRGKVLQQGSSFVVVQPIGDATQLGPFSAPGYNTADTLLKAALNIIPQGTKVCLDAPASNRSAMKLFNRSRMSIAGSNELMYAGVKPAYRPEHLYGMATMGSCG